MLNECLGSICTLGTRFFLHNHWSQSRQKTKCFCKLEVDLSIYCTCLWRRQQSSALSLTLLPLAIHFSLPGRVWSQIPLQIGRTYLEASLRPGFLLALHTRLLPCTNTSISYSFGHSMDLGKLLCCLWQYCLAIGNIESICAAGKSFCTLCCLGDHQKHHSSAVL